MDKCGLCSKPAVQLFETGKDGVYACFKCQPLVPEVTIEINAEEHQPQEQGNQSVKSEEENSDNQLYCAFCHKTFQKSAQLQNHLRNHRAERRFVCTYCNKAFSQSNNLRAHLRIHTNERPYKCNECGKAFTQVTNLNNHVRLHTGERPFVCAEPGCNKAFAQVTNLNQHRKRHQSGRPVEATYDCTVCGAQFQQRNHMYTHRREVHGEVSLSKSPQRSPPKRVACAQCDLTFPNERLLQSHALSHSTSGDEDADIKEEYTCVFRMCGARFDTPHEHTEHLLRAHQLRVLATRAPHPPRRGRPPKRGNAARPAQKVEEVIIDDDDPLEGKEPEFQEIRIVNADQFQFLPKLKMQSMFQ